MQGTLTATAQPRHHNNRLAARRTHLLASVINTGKSTHFTLIRATPPHIRPSRDNRTTGHFPSSAAYTEVTAKGYFRSISPTPTAQKQDAASAGRFPIEERERSSFGEPTFHRVESWLSKGGKEASLTEISRCIAHTYTLYIVRWMEPPAELGQAIQHQRCDGAKSKQRVLLSSEGLSSTCAHPVHTAFERLHTGGAMIYNILSLYLQSIRLLRLPELTALLQ